MICRTLLKSCATPPVSLPTASIFCAWRSWASASAPLGDRRRDPLLEEFVRLLQNLFGLLARRDVGGSGDRADDGPVNAAQRRRLDQDRGRGRRRRSAARAPARGFHVLARRAGAEDRSARLRPVAKRLERSAGGASFRRRQRRIDVGRQTQQFGRLAVAPCIRRLRIAGKPNGCSAAVSSTASSSAVRARSASAASRRMRAISRFALTRAINSRAENGLVR